ncbi:MAG TPA: toxin-antitoxin system HicB family antitoxin [Lachnospiraceae bacterium]|nr:toxin-antitoxin system HicB family antitoxin [Lachnospiraceae bacterium]
MVINDMLGFHGTSVNELAESFKNCINNYIEWCNESGKQPEKEFRGSFNIRISPRAHREAILEAAADGISLNQFVADAIDEKLARRKEASAVN